MALFDVRAHNFLRVFYLEAREFLMSIECLIIILSLIEKINPSLVFSIARARDFETDS